MKQQKAYIGKKIKRVIAYIILPIFIIAGTFSAIISAGSDNIEDYLQASNFEAIGSSVNYYFDEEAGHYNFVMPEGRALRILQLTDSHIGGGTFCKEKDRKVFDAMYKVIAASNPDLIIFTGDITYPFFPHSGNINNMKTAVQFASFMESLEIPWTLCFGNHDAESLALADKEELADYYAFDDLKYCIFTKNPIGYEDMTGYGNQIINIMNWDNTINMSLVILDSNDYINGNILKYDIIHDDQVGWYADSIEALSTEANGYGEVEVVPSLMFFHIPLNEYQTAWDLYQEGSSEVQYLYGVKDEDILAPTIEDNLPRGKLFDTMVALGSTKATFCGHNHMNNFAIIYNGIQLSYGNSLVYLGLHGIADKDNYRGGNLITVGQESSFHSELIFLKDIDNY